VLILVRHGESAWNADDRFAGQVDVGLTAVGRAEARVAGRRLRAQDLVPDVAHTSTLSRAIDTLDELLPLCSPHHVVVRRCPELDERHYGALQGVPRTRAVEVHGAEQVSRWRRGIHDRPPLDAAGRGESLVDVRIRLQPYVDDVLRPELDRGHHVLVVSHGNTMRMLCQLVQGLTDDEASRLDVPTGGIRVVDRVHVG
jgi:2,3-bisphosphoglycerate-dependent phosphoglycerate mutase